MRHMQLTGNHVQYNNATRFLLWSVSKRFVVRETCFTSRYPVMEQLDALEACSLRAFYSTIPRKKSIRIMFGETRMDLQQVQFGSSSLTRVVPEKMVMSRSALGSEAFSARLSSAAIPFTCMFGPVPMMPFPLSALGPCLCNACVAIPPSVIPPRVESPPPACAKTSWKRASVITNSTSFTFQGSSKDGPTPIPDIRL